MKLDDQNNIAHLNLLLTLSYANLEQVSITDCLGQSQELET
jgi:hypothetical protein